jgi:hypothetical protein
MVREFELHQNPNARSPYRSGDKRKIFIGVDGVIAEVLVRGRYKRILRHVRVVEPSREIQIIPIQSTAVVPFGKYTS